VEDDGRGGRLLRGREGREEGDACAKEKEADWLRKSRHG